MDEIPGLACRDIGRDGFGGVWEGDLEFCKALADGGLAHYRVLGGRDVGFVL